MNGAWTINAGGRLYGPFSSDRMRSFVSEGRLAANSLIARDSNTEWHEAGGEPEFAELFSAASNPTQDASGDRAAAEISPTPPALQEGQRSHFAIVVDLKSHAAAKLENAIAALGPAYRLLPNVWIVSTDQTVSAVRNRLVQELGKSDSLFVVDASRGKAAWFNFGPEADVRIRRVWQKAS
jgi:hypothetical protein